MAANQKNASDLFVAALEKEGVEVIYGVPGEENLDFLEALRKSSIRLILTRHEQGAAFMAATYGRLTGKVGVCLATLGPGATNFVTAAAYAQLGGFPMMMITGQKPVKKSKQGHFQIVDVVAMMQPLTKYAKQIVHGRTIPGIVREAVRIAQEERPGAVHLELPEDIAVEEVGEEPVFEPSYVRRPLADDIAVGKAVEMIHSCRHPLLLIGAGANRKRVSRQLAEFIDQMGIHFFNTQMGKGVVDGRNPHFLGTAALSDDDFLHCAVRKSDLIINVGHDVVEKPPFFMEHGGAKVIHVNFSTAVVDQVYFPQLEVVGDIADSLARILQQLGGPVAAHDSAYFKEVRKAVKRSVSDGYEDNRFPIFPARLVADIRKVMPSDGVIALDNGIYKIWFARSYQAHEPNTVLLDNALATMGAGLPSAMEVARLYPKRRVMAICGDGGFMMNSQEMETAVRLKLNLVVTILRDNAYGMIRWKQAGYGLPDFGLEYGNPDFVLYAQSYGAKGHRVSSSEQLRPLLDSCFEAGGVHLVEVPMDYSENVHLLSESLQKQVQQLQI